MTVLNFGWARQSGTVLSWWVSNTQCLFLVLSLNRLAPNLKEHAVRGKNVLNFPEFPWAGLTQASRVLSHVPAYWFESNLTAELLRGWIIPNWAAENGKMNRFHFTLLFMLDGDLIRSSRPMTICTTRAGFKLHEAVEKQKRFHDNTNQTWNIKLEWSSKWSKALMQSCFTALTRMTKLVIVSDASKHFQHL